MSQRLKQVRDNSLLVFGGGIIIGIIPASVLKALIHTILDPVGITPTNTVVEKAQTLQSYTSLFLVTTGLLVLTIAIVLLWKNETQSETAS